MSTFSFYTRGVLNAVPGQLLESDHRCVTYLNAQATPLYSSFNFAIGVFPASASTPITFTNTASGSVAPGIVVTDATPSPEEVLAQLYPILPTWLTVSYNPVTLLFTVTSTIPGTDGNFSTTIGASTFGLTVTAGVAPIIKAGRILVPVTNNNDLSTPQFDSTRRFRYPSITDTAATLSRAVISTLSMSSNQNRLVGRDTQRTVTPGSTGSAVAEGLVVMNSISALSGISNLFVETNVGADLVGRITATATGSTLALPAGKFFVESGTTTADRPVAIRLF